MPAKKAPGLKWIYGASLSILAIAVLLLVLAYIFTGDTIRKGIRIEQTDVSWLTRENAEMLVEENIGASCPDDRIFLSYGGRQWILMLSDINCRFLVRETVAKAYSIGRSGNLFQKVLNSLKLSTGKLKLDVAIDYDRDKLQEILKKIKSECDTTEKNAQITYVNGSVRIDKESIGRSLDIDRNIELIDNHIRKRDFGTIELQVHELKPRFTYDQIKEIRDKISSFSTRFKTSDANRSDNIRLACSRLDNRILMPGEIFSMNEALGPRTLENGYKEAPVILKDELIPGTGGGVCQVSSTLYNAVLLAGLDVIERTHHSMTLSYISPGRDATINESSIDFKFANDSDYPICLQADVKGGTVMIGILGRKNKADSKIRLSTQIIAEYPPDPEEVVFDPTLPIGGKEVERKAQKGVRVILYKEIYSSGNLLSREKLTEDYYKPVKGKMRLGSDLYQAYQAASVTGRPTEELYNP